MRARCFQLVAHVHVVFQVIFCPVGIQDVTSVTDCALADLVLLLDSIHRNAHVFDPVQAVKHPKDVNAGFCGNAHEFLNYVIGIVGITNPVGTAQQHLSHQVGHAFAQITQTLPGTFLQEAVSHVKGRAAPAFNREQLWQVGGIGGGHL